MKRAEQPILGIVAPARRPLSPSQRELVRRAGTYLSPGQQITARRRALRAELQAEADKGDRGDVANLQVRHMIAATIKRIGGPK